eukprot:augustus_masked-scaffold_2-processed-gene-16.44-mRNA-1 protein AED:0.32 eAED:0.32 QI:0/-1/0/1/-1/1/1/0/403
MNQFHWQQAQFSIPEQAPYQNPDFLQPGFGSSIPQRDFWPGQGGEIGIGATDFPPQPNKQNLYKTELCRKWETTGTCRYGAKCQFAHGRAELRTLVRHPLYKTTQCKSFQATGQCRYGSRCRFIHNETESQLKSVPRLPIGGPGSPVLQQSPGLMIPEPAITGANPVRRAQSPFAGSNSGHRTPEIPEFEPQGSFLETRRERYDSQPRLGALASGMNALSLGDRNQSAAANLDIFSETPYEMPRSSTSHDFSLGGSLNPSSLPNDISRNLTSNDLAAEVPRATRAKSPLGLGFGPGYKNTSMSLRDLNQGGLYRGTVLDEEPALSELKNSFTTAVPRFSTLRSHSATNLSKLAEADLDFTQELQREKTRTTEGIRLKSNSVTRYEGEANLNIFNSTETGLPAL